MTIRLLIHAPTSAALARARSNARNLLALHPEAMCEIVANGDAVAAALAAPDAAMDGRLMLCGNTLKRLELEPPAGMTVVAAAVAHIACRQSDGWAYLRA